MADRKTVKAAIKTHEKTLRRKPDVVGLGLMEEDGDAKLAVYVSSATRAAEIPQKVSVEIDGKTDDVDVQVVEIGKLTLR